jgi:adenosylmethionine-8-amino-7-oxononanoate aminotransferase
MARVELVRDSESRTPYPGAVDIGKLVSSQGGCAGSIVRPVENVNIMSPPLFLPREDVGFIVATLAKRSRSLTPKPRR